MTTTDIDPANLPRPNNTNKILSRRLTNALDRTTVVLTYTVEDAKRLRALAAGCKIKGRSVPLSLLSRRSLELYEELLDNPITMHRELQALTEMVTK